MMAVIDNRRPPKVNIIIGFVSTDGDKVKVLYLAGSGPNLISTTQKPIKTLVDLKGQTLRATGRIADTAQALGATSRPISIGETYESVKRNVISGVMLPLETMKAFRLGELLKYCTTDWQIGRLADWQIGRLADWQIGRLADWQYLHLLCGDEQEKMGQASGEY